MSATSALAPDAAMVVGIASTAMPFALSREDEAERWLRILRLHGEAGTALQAVGVGEGRLDSQALRVATKSPAPDERFEDPVVRVLERAEEIAERLGAGGITTIELLLAAMSFYGESFERVLRAHGTDRAEVLDRLGVDPEVVLDQAP